MLWGLNPSLPSCGHRLWSVPKGQLRAKTLLSTFLLEPQAEPPEVPTHPLPTPLSSKESPIKHWQTPVDESLAARTGTSRIKGELIEGGPVFPALLPGLTFPSARDHWRRGVDLDRTEALGTVNFRTRSAEEGCRCFPGVPETLWPQIHLSFHGDRTRATPTCLPHLQPGKHSPLFFLRIRV